MGDAFIYCVSKDKSKNEASLLGKKSCRLEAESDESQTAGFALVSVLHCCAAPGSSHFTLLSEKSHC